MNAEVEIFRPYIVPLFPEGAQIICDGVHRFRIKYSLIKAVGSRRYSRPIALYFEHLVIAEFSSSNTLRQGEIGRALQRVVRSSLDSYHEYGDQVTAHRINIDDLICDRR